ncbi:hypothetical protein [Dechloromonas sp.]|uniref:hypothetical protein n=1 Tax=Dechloromonas sp. TaxID=1917218 RepID=UPI001210EC6E|nr:hypothetical protein [Dechloromonas sp.]MBU3697624.1 sensor histidine kinase [Dechloromonas sp.]TEX48547.1 MAG: ATP-binding protein [Rhodocyclaceae bacterium]
MNRIREAVAQRLLARPNLLLMFHLAMIHVLAFGGWQDASLRLLWVAAFGIFLLWQPFVASSNTLRPLQIVLLWIVVTLSTVFLGPWLLLIWCGVLAAAIGGRVLRTVRRGERAGYLFAFGYLIVVTVLGAIPEISAGVDTSPLSRQAIAMGLPMLLPILLFFPARLVPERRARGFDLLYGLLVFLVLAAFVLGALSYMLIGRVGYLESLIKTSWVLAMALLLVAWAWNPRAGFAGIGASLSRALLTVGMPLEDWLAQLGEESERAQDPDDFVAGAMRRLFENPWVAGVSWQSQRQEGVLGLRQAHACDYRTEGLQLGLSFRHLPTEPIRWHAEWLLRLVAEFYQVKRQAQALQRLGYLQAVYETGARVTHDVKNLLQSLQALCYAAGQPGDPTQITALLGRQLPLIVERLAATLDKLKSTEGVDRMLIPANRWWHGARLRHEHLHLSWQSSGDASTPIPAALFDNVLDNLIHNALAKRQREPMLRIEVVLDNGALVVTDDGSPIVESTAGHLFEGPVSSEDGLGIGLYQSFTLAQEFGYLLTLADNRSGCVSFRLSAR